MARNIGQIQTGTTQQMAFRGNTKKLEAVGEKIINNPKTTAGLAAVSAATVLAIQKGFDCNKEVTLTTPSGLKISKVNDPYTSIKYRDSDGVGYNHYTIVGYDGAPVSESLPMTVGDIDMMKDAVNKFIEANSQFASWQKDISMVDGEYLILKLHNENDGTSYIIPGRNDKQFGIVWSNTPSFPSNPERVHHKFNSVNVTPEFKEYCKKRYQ